ncbi:hypothetical protein CONLIGDRAFT_363689 [Coniochaeta ligniaria NRRL 30616]|uniref:Alpha and gamma adaptin binding protein p34 n=1 Tax=Coniochaeta ligniaria NRRL 30616 TaxID=1408157 RepID=A0A1J7JLX8_9PEZI|nr:hypothetical protein CONLIGDRAFT_363689 [Coniochaeta ligniaria NRRL 30616]
MNVGNPRRILAVSLTDSSDHLSRVVKDLTGTNPTQAIDGGSETSTLAGTTHSLSISTAYYKAEVPVWLDLITEPAEWADTFLSAEAREVLDVLGGVVVIFALPRAGAGGGEGRGGVEGEAGAGGSGVRQPPSGGEETRELIRHVGRVVREGLGGWEWDGVGLAVGVGDVDFGGDGLEVLDEWEDACAEWGLEFVHVPVKEDKARGKNEFEKTGIPRVLEALESNDWAQADGFGDEDDDEDSELGEGDSRSRAATKSKAAASTELEDPPDLDPESLEFGFDKEDFAGLKKAIWSSGREEGDEEEETEEDVQKLEGMMRKLLAVRDMSAGLPEEQRKRMAKKAVGEVMKEL